MCQSPDSSAKLERRHQQLTRSRPELDSLTGVQLPRVVLLVNKQAPSKREARKGERTFLRIAQVPCSNFLWIRAG